MFNDDFLWGAASAAYQVEGAAYEDGKSEGIWDYFSKIKGKIAFNENGDESTDHYHRYKEDVALMKQMGLKCYRFSISWPRVLPDGTGEINQKGLQFYSDLVDELINAGIEPMVTLFHWNLPMTLYKLGGWKNDEISSWFEEYTKVVVDKLSDRVKYWITINEPQMFIGAGLSAGFHAPFECNSQKDVMKAIRNTLLSHGKAVAVIRKYAKQKPIIGMAPTGSSCIPKDDSKEALDEARNVTFRLDKEKYGLSNVIWADPVFLGKFPDEAYEIFGEDLPKFSKEEWTIVSEPLDFYGYNVYEAISTSFKLLTEYNDYSYMGSPKTTMGWSITPDVLYYSTKFFYERYKKPILITENGMSNTDWVSLDNCVHDPQRIDFIHRYLLSLKKATDEGIPVIGYMYWSLIDNFEWTQGYDKRFGLIYVDYKTKERTLKDSAKWYSEVIKNNGNNL